MPEAIPVQMPCGEWITVVFTEIDYQRFPKLREPGDFREGYVFGKYTCPKCEKTKAQRIMREIRQYNAG